MNGTWDGHALRVRIGKPWRQIGVPLWVPPALVATVLGAIAVWASGLDTSAAQPWLKWIWNLTVVALAAWTFLGPFPVRTRFNVEANAEGLQMRQLHPLWHLLREEPGGWTIGRVESVSKPWGEVRGARYLPATLDTRDGLEVELDDRVIVLISDGEATVAIAGLAAEIERRAQVASPRHRADGGKHARRP